MSNASLVKLKQNVGSPMIRNSECDRTAFCIANAVSKISFAYFLYPSRPKLTIAAHVAASSPPLREPSMPGEAYFPPDQSVMKKYCPSRSDLCRNANTEVPLKP